MVFSGVGKTEAEMEAALAAGILCFNVESAAELDPLDAVAGRVGRVAPVSFRVNPDVDPRTHPYIATGLKESKFGVAFADAPALYRRAAACRTSRCTESTAISARRSPTSPSTSKRRTRCSRWSTAIEADGHAARARRSGRRASASATATRCRSPLDDYARIVRAPVARAATELLFEPGRFLVGDAGVLLTRVFYLKPGDERDFAIVDAAMNDLLRPALYDAWHPVERGASARRRARRWQIVGPVCESGDFLAHDRELALADGRSPRHRAARRIRVRHELELQRASARLRGAGRRRNRCISSAAASASRSFSRSESALPGTA